MRLGLAVTFAVVVVVFLVWWQDRTLVHAETLLQSGEAPAALAELNRFLARHPTHQSALLLKARTLVAIEQWSEASDLFAMTGASTPDELRAWSTALLHQRKWREALPILEQLVEFQEHDADCLRNLTVCQHQLGYMQEALESAARLASLPGRSIDGLFQRGVIYRSLGDTHLAIENWEQIEELSPDASGLSIQPAEFFRVYAEDLMLEARQRLAAIYFRRSLAEQRNAEVLAQLGEAEYWSGQTVAARTAWLDALQIDENNSRARLGLAELALSQSDPESAIQWLEPLGTDPTGAGQAAYLLQRSYTLLSDEELAEQWQGKVAMVRKSRKLQAAFDAQSN